MFISFILPVHHQHHHHPTHSNIHIAILFIILMNIYSIWAIFFLCYSHCIQKFRTCVSFFLFCVYTNGFDNTVKRQVCNLYSWTFPLHFVLGFITKSFRFFPCMYCFLYIWARKQKTEKKQMNEKNRPSNWCLILSVDLKKKQHECVQNHNEKSWRIDFNFRTSEKRFYRFEWLRIGRKKSMKNWMKPQSLFYSLWNYKLWLGCRSQKMHQFFEIVQKFWILLTRFLASSFSPSAIFIETTSIGIYQLSQAGLSYNKSFSMCVCFSLRVEY